MARIRTIKPDFFTDEGIVALSPLARLFYIALWCEADREGRLEWRLKTLKWKYLPQDDCDIEAIGKELTDAGRIVLYTADGKIYALIPTFNEHQHVNVKEAASRIPAPPGAKRVRARAKPVNARESTGGDGAEPGDSRGEGKGRELEGKGNNPPSSPQGDTYPQEFEALWGSYPSRGKHPNPKKPAYEAFLKAISDGAEWQDLEAAARRFSKTAGENAGTEFVPQLRTWLEEERWKDAPVVVDIGNPEENLWKARIIGWRDRNGFWNRDQYGPAPNEANCKAPKRLLAELIPFDPERDTPDFMKRNLTMAG